MQSALQLPDDDLLNVGGPEEEVPTEPVDLDLYAERRMWRIRQLVQEQQRNTAQADEIAAPLRARLEMVEVWLAEQNHALQQQIDFLTQQVERVALSYPFDGKTKSRKMPAGTFGKRKVPEKLDIVDKDAAVAWAEQSGLVEIVRVTKAPDAVKLREYFQSTGTLPAGCQHVAEYEKPYCKVGG